MDPKSIKNNLKKAREALKSKDINTALNLCKAVLKEDRNNYVALVILGAALQETEQKDQAPNAYRKATEVAPDQVLAWQGLALFYEKNDANKCAEQIIPVYLRLLQLESDSTKWCEIVSKLQPLVSNVQDDASVVQLIESNKDTNDEDKRDTLYKLVRCYVSEVDKIPEESLKVFEEILGSSVNDSDDQAQVHLKLLHKQGRFRECLERADQLSDDSLRDPSLLEWLCQVCAEQFVEDRDSIVEQVGRLPRFADALLLVDDANKWALVAQAAYFTSRRAFLEARDCLHRCRPKGLFPAQCLLAEAELQLLCVPQALSAAQAAASLLPSHQAPRAIRAAALASVDDDESSWTGAIELAKEVVGAEGWAGRLAAEALCSALLRLGQWQQLTEALPLVSGHSPALAELLRLEVEVRGEGDQLMARLASDTPDSPHAWYRLAKLYKDAGSLNEACTAFLKCAKLAPHWYTAYLELGHLYSGVPDTVDKARRCYQRALVLRPNHKPTQMALSDTYHKLGDSENNLALLQGIASSEGGQWAFPRLAFQHSSLGDTSKAISCLRGALKTDPTNSHLWEALADAYLAREAHGAALKSYQRVLELRPGAFYPALQIATIKQMTDLAEESLVEFRALVEQQPDSVLVLKGLAETCLCLADSLQSKRLLGLARDRLQEGLNTAARGVELKPSLACLWKLAGDCLTRAGALPTSWHWLTVPTSLCSASDSNKEPQTLRGQKLLELGARCLCRCLKLMSGPLAALVWHDLAVNYRLQARTVPESASRALAAARQSVMLDCRHWQHWNQLGIVAALPEVKKLALAQHAFIKATMVDETAAAPWANLGVLYLSLGELHLANGAFSAAQRADSEFCPGWLGQALVAEQVNSEQTMDLFRHTTQLGYHSESGLGYGQWVCHTLQTVQTARLKAQQNYVYSIERMHAVPVAVDALTWATEGEAEQDSCGLNMLGCLLERCGRYQTAVQVLSRAVDRAPEDHRDKVLANFARVLLKAEKVEDAIQVYRAVAKADIHSQCGLALALYKGKQFNEAYETYQAALDWWAADDGVKAQLHTALAAVAYHLDGHDRAKTLLLQGNQLKPVSVDGLLASCALGMLHGDLELSKAMLRELVTHQDVPEYMAHVALFQAYTKFIQGDAQGSVWSMSHAVHRCPSLAELWMHLALLIVNRQNLGVGGGGGVAVAAQCARTAMTLGRTHMDVSKVLAVVSLSQLLGGEMSAALSASQHAVHLYPAVGESWAVLAASCLAAGHNTPLRPLVSHARQHISLERPLAKWMSNFERKIAMMAF